jgi:predicted flap endonuclease-1-like 5' DNA nuclease
LVRVQFIFNDKGVKIDNNQQIRENLDPVIKELENRGIKHNDDYDIRGIGDVVEDVLTAFGITEEKFKAFWNLQECECTNRKKFLNGIFHWRRKRKDS